MVYNQHMKSGSEDEIMKYHHICTTEIPTPVSLHLYFDGFVQDGSISIANALEILQSYTKPLIW